MSGAGAQVMNDLVLGSRILAHEGVLDAFGHLSVRHPDQADRFLISRSLSPELVQLADLQLFNLEGKRVGGNEGPSYVEVPIHAALYRRRPDIGSVSHTHSAGVVPFGVTGASLRPIFHMGSVAGSAIPVFDIADRFGDTDLLVRTMEHGDALAAVLGQGTTALMRGHGVAIVASDARSAVFISLYLERNAQLLQQALRLGEPRYLTDEETKLASAALLGPGPLGRAWEHWVSRLPARAG